MRVNKFAFDEEHIPLDQPDSKRRIPARSPGGKVPVLIDGATAMREWVAAGKAETEVIAADEA